MQDIVDSLFYIINTTRLVMNDISYTPKVESSAISRNTKATKVRAHIEEYSRKAKANRNSVNAFTPSNAYYIMGHGGTTDETFIVPEDCMVVVKVAEGELFYQTDKYFPIIYNMDLSILTDPIRKRPELVKALGSVAIYYPGASCPNFTYTVINYNTLQNPTILSEFGSGVTDISLYKEDQHKSTLRHSVTHDTLSTFKEMKARRNNNEIKKFIMDAYQYSIYPTPQQVETAIDKLIDNNITDINDIITAMMRLHVFNPTQEDLCQMKGVFYNFVCRPNDSLKPIFKIVNRGNNFTNELANNVQGLLTLQNSPAPFHNTNSIRSYSETLRRTKLQKLKDAEANLKAAKKEYTNTAYGNNGSDERKKWNQAVHKKLEANKRVKSLKNNTIRKSLRSRLEESIAFRKPGIYNTIKSSRYNAMRKSLQSRLEEARSEKNTKLLTLKKALASNEIEIQKNTNTLSKIQKSINNMTSKLNNNEKENKKNLSEKKSKLEEEYAEIKRFIDSSLVRKGIRNQKVRNIEDKYDKKIALIEKEIELIEKEIEDPPSKGGRIRLNRTHKR